MTAPRAPLFRGFLRERGKVKFKQDVRLEF